jgi:hypothetical protein
LSPNVVINILIGFSLLKLYFCFRFKNYLNTN